MRRVKGVHRIYKAGLHVPIERGHQLSVEREYSTAQQYTVSESHNCASVHKTSRKLSHVAVSRTHFSNIPPHLTRPTSPSSSGRVGGISENQVLRPELHVWEVLCVSCTYIWIYELPYSLTFRIGQADRQTDSSTERKRAGQGKAIAIGSGQKWECGAEGSRGGPGHPPRLP